MHFQWATKNDDFNDASENQQVCAASLKTEKADIERKNGNSSEFTTVSIFPFSVRLSLFRDAHQSVQVVSLNQQIVNDAKNNGS